MLYFIYYTLYFMYYYILQKMLNALGNAGNLSCMWSGPNNV